jgi:hypothetical protein
MSSTHRSRSNLRTPADRQGDRGPGRDVRGRDAPAELVADHDRGHFAHERGRDEEGQGDREGDAGGDEPDEQRDRAARAQWRDGAEHDREDEPGEQALARQVVARPLEVKAGAQIPTNIRPARSRKIFTVS